MDVARICPVSKSRAKTSPCRAGSLIPTVAIDRGRVVSSVIRAYLFKNGGHCVAQRIITTDSTFRQLNY